MEVETGVMHQQIKSDQGFPATPEAKRKAWKKPSSRNFRESIVLSTHLGFGPLASETFR